MDETTWARIPRRRLRIPETGRRSFLKSVLGALVVLPAGAAFAAPGSLSPGSLLAGPLLAGPFPGGPVAQRRGEFFLVEGWVLTEADLRGLGIALPDSAGAAEGGLA